MAMVDIVAKPSVPRPGMAQRSESEAETPVPFHEPIPFQGPVRFRESGRFQESLAAERERDGDGYAPGVSRSLLRMRIAQLKAEREDLLLQLDQAYRQPLRPLEYFAFHVWRNALSLLVRPFSRRAAEQIKSAAKKRSPRRFRALLAGEIDPAPAPELPHGPEPSCDWEAMTRRILVADWRVPHPDISAGEQMTAGILKDLCALGYDVTFISTDMHEAAPYDESLRSIGVTVINDASGYRDSRDYIEREGHGFGVFYLIRVNVAEIVLASARKVAPRARVIFHAPDLFFLRETREAQVKNDLAALTKANQTRQRELAMMGASDHVVLVSEAELPILRAELPDAPISVFPALYAKVTREPNGYASRRDIFFLGGFEHSPNVHGVAWFAENVWPLVHKALPEVLFKIVGSRMPTEVVELGQRPGIEILGYAPDLAPILDGCRVGVAPLLFGAGIKGKVAATMGAGIPCVCTTIAAEGMGLVDGLHARVADDPLVFADAIIALYTDEKLWMRLSLNGRAWIEARFGEAANRASLLSALNDARALPSSLFIEHCNKAAPLALPAYDPSIIPDVSIIVPVYNKWGLTRACLNSVVLTSLDAGLHYEIILADDGSTDETVNAAEIFPGLRIARTPVNLGFLRNCNHAATQARGRYILLLNNDTIVLPGWLKALYRAMEADPRMAIAGSKLLYPDGLVQEAGAALFRSGAVVNFGRGLARDAPIVGIAREADYVSGASILIRTDFWQKVGGFDERYKNAYCEDSDLAMTARAQGKYVWYEPASEVIHFEHQTYLEQAPAQNSALQSHNNALLREKWRDIFDKDHLPEQDWRFAAGKVQRQVPASVLARRKSGKLNVLYFSPFPSHPSDCPNQARIQRLGRRFQKLGHKVHFALLKSNMIDAAAEQAMREAWDRFDIVGDADRVLLDGREVPFDGWYPEGLGEDVRLLCSKYDVDVVVCSYIFQSRILKYTPAYILKVIDTHGRMGGRSDLLRANGQALDLFSCAPEEEGAYLRRADVVIAPGDEEARYFNAATERDTAIVIPSVEESRFIDRTFDRLENIGVVVSSSRVSFMMLKAFLEAFARQTGSACSFAIHVAGPVEDLLVDLPEPERAVFLAPWLRLHGHVPDIEAFYQAVDAVASPIVTGAGDNAATLQAMAYGMPVITTRWGSKGVETDEPMHNHANLDALVRGLHAFVQQPEALSRLAKVSRDRYAALSEQANVATEGLFRHEKLIDLKAE